MAAHLRNEGRVAIFIPSGFNVEFRHKVCLRQRICDYLYSEASHLPQKCQKGLHWLLVEGRTLRNEGRAAVSFLGDFGVEFGLAVDAAFRRTNALPTSEILDDSMNFTLHPA